MKKILTTALMLMIAFSFSNAMSKMQMFQSVSLDKAQLLQQNESKLYCPNCGMNLPKFYKTNHAVKLNDGSVRQYCSIYCLVEEMELTVLRGKKDSVEKIMVVDVPSLKFIDAKTAHYVVGSKKPGTMTTTSKYAFKDETDAQAFASKNGGEVVSFDQAYKVALTDFAKDTAMVYKKRSSKMYKMGKKLYQKQCNMEKMEALDAHTMGDMKELIKANKVCGEGLSDGQLQGIMLYWWDVKMNKFEQLHGKNEEVQKYIKMMNKK